MYRRRKSRGVFGVNRRTMNNMEAWIGSNQGHIEMNLRNQNNKKKFREVDAIRVMIGDAAFEHDNPMSSDMRASLKLTQSQVRPNGAGNEVPDVTSTFDAHDDSNAAKNDEVFSGSNPYAMSI